MKIKASIIIRTFNEEDWIGHCLSEIKNQNFTNYEIIIVDNCSTDNTVKIAKSFGIKKIIKIKKFIPGKALNMGCEISTGEYVVFLSAHCVPENKNWLKNLLVNFRNKKIAAVYGKQSPIKFSSAQDIRDLYITFGNERKIQKKDYFFHNANSAIRKSVWKKNKFSNKLTNIEDRHWSKKIIELKYWIAYEPKANVFHHHGIHHGSNLERLNSTIKVIEKIEKNDFLKLPETLKPENIKLLFVLNYSNYKKSKIFDNFFIKESSLINKLDVKHQTIFIKPRNFPKKIIPKNFEIYNNKKKSNLTESLKKCVKKIIKKNYFPDYVVYINIDYIFRPKDLIINLIKQACLNGYEAVVPSIKNFNTNFIYDNKEQKYDVFGKELINRTEKVPLYTSFYGLGTIVKTKIASKGLLIADNKNGLLNIKNKFETIRISELSKKNIKILSIIENEK